MKWQEKQCAVNITGFVRWELKSRVRLKSSTWAQTLYPFAEVTSGKRWRLVLLYRIGFKQFSEVRNCTRFLFAFSKVLRKRIVLLMPRQRDSRASFGRTETFVRHSTRFDHLSQRAFEDFTEPARETSSLKRKTFTKWYFTHALYFKNRCTFSALHALIWIPSGRSRVKLWMVSRVLFPQVCCIALVGGVKHPSRTLVVWLTC